MLGLDDIIAEGMKIIDKFIPDPQAKMNAQVEMMRITQADKFKEIDAQLQTMQMQADINKVEAGNSSIFVAGWRPSVGWVCSIGLGLQVIIFPIIATVSTAIGHPVTMPEMPVEVLMTNLGGLLGFGGFRTWEKVKGVK